MSITFLLTGVSSGAGTVYPSEHLSSPPVYSRLRVTRSLVLYVCFVDRCLFFCTFSFGHCVVCSSIYGFWLPPFGIFKLFFWLFYIEYLFQENMQISEAYSGIKRFFFVKKHLLLKTQISDQIFNYLIKCNKLFCREHFPFVEVKVYV
jgi:hypothetical protein